jgi:DNA-directed RNA polymerase subunit B
LRDLVKLYFDERNIVNHHISSFNDFLSTPDNPNSRMQRIVDDIRVPTDDADRGVIRLDPERTGGRSIEIRIGRKRDEDGSVDPLARPTIRIDEPKVMEANGYSHDLSPMEARLRNLNYMSPVFVHFDIIEDGVEKEIPESERWIHVGDLPMMVKSKDATSTGR